LRELREIRLRRGLSQADLSAMTGVAEFTISEIESGKRANPRPSTLRKLAQGLGVEVTDLYGELDSPLGVAPPSSTQPPLNGFEEERRFSRFGEAIIAVAARWGEAVSSPDMNDGERLAIIRAALQLSDVISERVEDENWETIPNRERLEIVTTMEKLVEAANQGLRHAEESKEAGDQEEEVKRRREQIREWNRRKSA
jgi:transcriptional regulator with XRE-family HTH domain